jgi:hypothetical protein
MINRPYVTDVYGTPSSFILHILLYQLQPLATGLLALTIAIRSSLCYTTRPYKELQIE